MSYQPTLDTLPYRFFRLVCVRLIPVSMSINVSQLNASFPLYVD
ncbi:MAG: hypothetical protein ACI86M_001487 [Saprospiraceae bacterium]|jgi:hypothetical protein